MERLFTWWTTELKWQPEHDKKCILSQISQSLKILGISATKLTIAETHINQHINYKASLGLQKITLTETFGNEKFLLKRIKTFINTSHWRKTDKANKYKRVIYLLSDRGKIQMPVNMTVNRIVGNCELPVQFQAWGEGSIWEFKGTFIKWLHFTLLL